MIDPKYLETLERMRTEMNRGRFSTDAERDALAFAIKELRTMGEIEAAVTSLEFSAELLRCDGFVLGIHRELFGNFVVSIDGQEFGNYTSLADAWESIKQEKGE